MLLLTPDIPRRLSQWVQVEGPGDDAHSAAWVDYLITGG